MSTREPVTGNNIDHWQKVAQDDTARKENREWGKNSDTSWVFVEGGTTHSKEDTINVFANTSAITRVIT